MKPKHLSYLGFTIKMEDKDIDAVIKPMLEIVDYWYCVDLPTLILALAFK